ncbi:MAG: PAS-domain containing protein [Pseudomonadota bacterium]
MITRQTLQRYAREIGDLGIGEKLNAMVTLLVLLTAFLLTMSVQAVRLQSAFREDLAAASMAAINIERVNGLIYAIVMESRGIYMSTERVKVKRYGDELLKRNRELADVVSNWEKELRSDDVEQFLGFKQRIAQFIEFRKELVRRAIEISPAAGREWGDNDANRALRTELNTDLEALARIHSDRAHEVADLGDKGRYASWYLFFLGLGALTLAGVIWWLMKSHVIGPLAQITHATDRIAAGKTELVIPFIERNDEIGQLARAVQHFRDTTCRNFELEQLEIDTARQRDSAIGERDKLNDKYLETKWQLGAALNNMAQGLVMFDSKTKILMTNIAFRTMYELPPHIIQAETTLRDILVYRAGKDLFTGNIDDFMVDVLDRIARGKPSVRELSLADGRIIRVSEQPMAGGGWVSTHEDFTEQRRGQRILERTEQFLVAVIENVPEGIIAKDARTLRYVFVNRAAEQMIGMLRTEIIGKTARELFPAQAAELIEQRDRQLLTQNQQLEEIVDTVDNPRRGRRTIAVRRLQVGGADRESHLLVSMVEDRTDQTRVANVAA